MDESMGVTGPHGPFFPREFEPDNVKTSFDDDSGVITILFNVPFICSSIAKCLSDYDDEVGKLLTNKRYQEYLVHFDMKMSTAEMRMVLFPKDAMPSEYEE